MKKKPQTIESSSICVDKSISFNRSGSRSNASMAKRKRPFGDVIRFELL